MRWNALLGGTSTLLYLLPIVFLITWRLYCNRSLLALLIFFTVSFLDNLISEGWLPVSINLRRDFHTLSSYLDAPLMLIVLLFFCIQQWKRQMILITLAALLIYEISVATVFHFSARSVKMVLGPGILVILLFSFLFFLQQVKQTITRNRRSGNTVLNAAILFAYGCYALLYVFYHLLQTTAVEDVFLLHHITSIIFCISATTGLYYVRQKAKELEDLKITRKELALFFNS